MSAASANGSRVGRRYRLEQVSPALLLVLLLLASAFVALTIAVVQGSPLAGLDRFSFALDPRRHWPDVLPWVRQYVVLGQRGPTALVFGTWTAWQSWRRRDPAPIVRFLLALALLNLGVGAVKIATGRLGPSATEHVHRVFAGGDIFPSGHTSNAVVVYGVVAGNARRYRPAVLAVAGLLAVTVGMSTIFLETHWATDVLGGWLAGLIVLVCVPGIAPPATTALRRLSRGRVAPPQH